MCDFVSFRLEAEIAAARSEAAALREELASSAMREGSLETMLDRSAAKIASMRHEHLALANCFSFWRQRAIEKQREEHHTRLADRQIRAVRLRHAFGGWWSVARDSKEEGARVLLPILC
jgi:hypothetical protein